MKTTIYMCIVVFYCATVRAFPAEVSQDDKPKEIRENFSGGTELKETQTSNGPRYAVCFFYVGSRQYLKLYLNVLLYFTV